VVGAFALLAVAFVCVVITWLIVSLLQCTMQAYRDAQERATPLEQMGSANENN
jgi:hypothetical protein